MVIGASMRSPLRLLQRSEVGVYEGKGAAALFFMIATPFYFLLEERFSLKYTLWIVSCVFYDVLGLFLKRGLHV